MNKRFVKLYESIVNRYNRGGFLTSDVVKFIPDVLKDTYFKDVDDDYKKKIEEYVNCGCNLRVRNVKSSVPAVMGAGNPDYNGYGFVADICKEIAPGTYDNESVTVPVHLLVKVNSVPNLPAVPDKFRRKDDTQIEPVEIKDENEEVPFFSPGRTKTADRGNKKDTASETSLLNKNIRIPSSPAKGAANPASYTASYLP